MIIKNRQDLRDQCGRDPATWAYKYTPSGVSLFVDEKAHCVTVTPYIEGEEGETHESVSISFPFLFTTLERLVDQADSTAFSYSEGRFEGIDTDGNVRLEEYDWDRLWVSNRYWMREPDPQGVFAVRITENGEESVLWRGDSHEEYLLMYEIFLRRLLDDLGIYNPVDMESAEETLEANGIVLEGVRA